MWLLQSCAVWGGALPSRLSGHATPQSPDSIPQTLSLSGILSPNLRVPVCLWPLPPILRGFTSSWVVASTVILWCAEVIGWRWGTGSFGSKQSRGVGSRRDQQRGDLRMKEKWKCKSLSHVRLFCYPMDCSLSGSSIHGILQAILEWVIMPSSRGSSRPWDWTQVSHIAGRFFTIWITREVSGWNIYILNHLLACCL